MAKTLGRGRSSGRRFGGPALRGVVLLEVVVSLGILLMAMAVIGLVFNNGQHNLQMSERRTRAMMLTDRLVAEMDTGYLELEEQEQSGFFGVEGEQGMSWRVEVNPDEQITGLLNVDLHIYMGDPDGPDEERLRILSTHVHRAEPMGLDFERDFGFDEEQIAQLTDAIPGGEAVLDPTDFDPRELASLDLDTLVDILPALLEALGSGFGGGQLNELIDAASSGDLSGLQELGKAASGAIGNSAGGTGGPEDGDRPVRRFDRDNDQGDGSGGRRPPRGGPQDGDGAGGGRGPRSGPRDDNDNGPVERRPDTRGRRGGGRG